MARAPGLDHEFPSLRKSAFAHAYDVGSFITSVTIGPSAVPEVKTEIQAENSDSEPEDQSSFLSLDNSYNYDQFIETEDGAVNLNRLIHACNKNHDRQVNHLRDEMLDKFIAQYDEAMNKFRYKRKVECETKLRIKVTRELEIHRELDELAKIEDDQFERQNKAHSERLKKILEKQKESSELSKRLSSIYSEICECYHSIVYMCSEDPLTQEILNKYSSNMTNIISSVNTLIQQSKTQHVTYEDVQKVSILRQAVETLKLIIIDEIEHARHTAAEVAKAEPPEAPVEPVKEEIKPQIEPVRQEVKPTVNLSQFYSERSFKIYWELREFLNMYENNHRDILTNPSYKKFKFDCRKAINTPVNALSSLNSEHIRDKYEKLFRLLNGETVTVGDSYVSATQHPEGIYYCMNLLAQKIVQQGELLVSSKPEAAFPLASIVVALWARFPDFGKLLNAHFHRVCPYTVPMILPQLADQSVEDFYKVRGYVYNDDGEVEKQDKFLKRMSGIFKLYAAIWVSEMPSVSSQTPHPQNVSDAWRWLAAFVNLDPESDISATLLYDFLTICGSSMFKYYNIQFVKILKHLIGDYYKKLERIDNGGPKCRLEVFLNSVIQSGQISPPEGMIPKNYW